MWGRFVSIYDNQGNQIGNEQYDGEGQLEWQRIHHYNDQGIEIGFDEYDGEGNLIRSEVEE